MSYQKINPIKQFNFQINRVLTYGERACDTQKVREKTASIRTIENWKQVWRTLGKEAEEKQKYLQAAYAYRMAEFFLKDIDSQKQQLYQQCIEAFYHAFDTELHLRYEKHLIPFEGKYLNCIKLSVPNSKGTVLVCGGYDSFIEEFVLQVNDLASAGYEVLLFEGPGQGNCLQQAMYFRYDFEKPTAAVLDYFHIDCCAMVGISWGGYFALRCAAFEKRIVAAAAYDTMDNGLEVMTHIFPPLICKIIRWAYSRGNETFVNTLARKLQKRSILADWALSQGMYITGTQTPFAFYKALSQHTLKGLGKRITQDILLLAGEKDHYIPLNQFDRTKKNLQNAKSLTCRLFTKAEGGEQHCQIGNHMLAVQTILDWLDSCFCV